MENGADIFPETADIETASEDYASRFAGEVGRYFLQVQADITLQLHQTLCPQIEPDAKLNHIYRNIEMPLRDVLFTVERNGVLLDSRLLNVQSRELGEKLIAIEARAFEAAGQPFNLNSPKQLREILYDDTRRVAGPGRGPSSARLFDVRGTDTLELRLTIDDAVASDTRAGLIERGEGVYARQLATPWFLQMKGRAHLTGRISGRTIAGDGTGFFETYR